MDGWLHRYFLNNAEKRLHKWAHYFDIYERHLSRLRNQKPVILEIGVFGGGSLKMWKEYFGCDAQIVGLDIEESCKQYEEPGIEIFIGSQDDPAVIGDILEKYSALDVVIDDGSHRMEHMTASFDLLYPFITDGGVYLVEDTHTCYWEEYGGGLHQPLSFIEFAKSKIDEINAVHTRGQVRQTELTKLTDAIVFYDSVVVFEKRRQSFRQAFKTGPM